MLWPGLVMDYAQTSGTTAGDKYNPSHARCSGATTAPLPTSSNATRFGVSPPVRHGGKVLFLGGSTDLTVNPHGVRTGDLSGIVTPLIR